MSWRENTEAAAIDMARLLVRDDVVDTGDLDIALSARRRVLELAATVHRDLTGAGAGSAAPTLTGLADDPVRTLGQLIHRQPRPHPHTSPLEAVAGPAVGPSGAIWAQLAEHATLAQHHWATGQPASRPAGDAAWSVLDHVALMVRAVSVLDEGLALAAWRAGRHDVTEQLLRGTTSGLQEAALVVHEMALNGALPRPEDLAQPPSRQLVAVVDRFDLAPALSGLHQQLSTSAHLGPAQLQAVARAVSRTCAYSAALVHEAAGLHLGAGGEQQSSGKEAPQLASALHEHAVHLAQVAAVSRRAESIHPSDPVPLVQAKAITTWLVLNPARPSTAVPGRDLALGRDVGVGAGQVSRTLERLGRGLHDQGRWLVPAAEAWSSVHSYDWIPSQPASKNEPAPQLLSALQNAAQHADVLRRVTGPRVPATGSTPGSAATGQAVGRGMESSSTLATALQAHREAGGRPCSPAVAVSATGMSRGRGRTH